MLLLLTGKGVTWFIASNVKKTTKCSECTKNGPKSPLFCRRLRFLCNFAHRALLPKKRDIWSGGRAKKTSAGIYLFMMYCMVNLTVHCVQQVWSVFWYRYHYIQIKIVLELVQLHKYLCKIPILLLLRRKLFRNLYKIILSKRIPAW